MFMTRVAEWLKRQTVNLLRNCVVGSNPTPSKNYLFKIH